MDVKTASYFLAVLALLCLAATVVSIVVLVLAATRPAGTDTGVAGWRSDLGRSALGLAFVVAAACTAGSLYLSEIADFTPCPLCWYQRICMYPLVLLLGIAAFRRDRSIRFYALPLAAIGAVISAYHAWIQAFPPSGGSSFCTLEAPCTERYIWEFGFVSIPFMALCGFAFIIVMMVATRPPADDDGNQLRSENDEQATTTA